MFSFFFHSSVARATKTRHQLSVCVCVPACLSLSLSMYPSVCAERDPGAGRLSAVFILTELATKAQDDFDEAILQSSNVSPKCRVCVCVRTALLCSFPFLTQGCCGCGIACRLLRSATTCSTPSLTARFNRWSRLHLAFCSAVFVCAFSSVCVYVCVCACTRVSLPCACATCSG